MRFNYIDNLKGIAILFVLAVHFNGYMPIGGVWSKICTEGASMPQLFFIVSAFLAWHSLDKKPVNSFKSYCDYLKSKWIRLSPIYYLALLIAVLLSLITATPKKSIADYLMHLTYTNGFVPQFTNDILGVEWYISVLAIFFFVAPFLKKLVINLVSSLYLLIVVMLISGLSTALIPSHFYVDEIAHTYLITTGWVAEIPTLVCGIVLYYLIRNNDRDNLENIKIHIFTVTIAFVLVLTSQYSKLYGIQLFTGWRMVAYFLALLFFSKVCKNMPKLPILSNLGLHSYGIYCYHILVIKALRLLPLHLEDNIVNWMFLYVTVLIISYSFTIMVEKLVNRFHFI